MLPYFTSHLLSDVPHIRHGFFTREGGVSEGDFATLNVAQEKGDNPEHVHENRIRIAQALKFAPERLVTVRQVHSTRVLVIDMPFEEDLPEGDALITTTPGLFISVITADCVPVLLSSPEGDVVGAVHAGWKGAVEGVLEEAVYAMKKQGAKEIVAALGPCIWQDSYEVSQEFYDRLKDVPSFFKEGRRPHHWQFDLPGYVIYRLRQCGVLNIESSPANTYDDPQRFFSCRRKTILGEAQFGCQLSGIGINNG